MTNGLGEDQYWCMKRLLHGLLMSDKTTVCKITCCFTENLARLEIVGAGSMFCC